MISGSMHAASDDQHDAGDENDNAAEYRYQTAGRDSSREDPHSPTRELTDGIIIKKPVLGMVNFEKRVLKLTDSIEDIADGNNQSTSNLMYRAVYQKP